MTKIYLIRHGETVHNIEGRISGQTETKLTEKGIKQAITAGESMYKKGMVPDVILCCGHEKSGQQLHEDGDCGYSAPMLWNAVYIRSGIGIR